MIPFKQSPNYHKGRYAKIKYIVIHAMVGWYKYTTETLFMTPGRTSAHYSVSMNGDVIQQVHDQDTAYHVCRANPFCIGIEHEDGGACMKNGKWITPELWKASVKLTADLCIRYGIPVCNIIGHEDPLLRPYGNTHVDPGPYFHMREYQLSVQNEINSRHPIAKIHTRLGGFKRMWHSFFQPLDESPFCQMYEISDVLTNADKLQYLSSRMERDS